MLVHRTDEYIQQFRMSVNLHEAYYACYCPLTPFAALNSVTHCDVRYTSSFLLDNHVTT